MNIKKKNFILIIMLTIAGTLLFTCGIFAVVNKSVSFNLALKLDPQIYFSLSMRIDYDGDGNYTGTHPSDDQISEGTPYTIFNNSANATGLVNWATVNQNCIVLNQVLAGNILSNLTVNSRFEITVTNLTQSNEVKYLNLTLNYNGAEEVFKADNGYGAVNMRYGVASGDTSATKSFILIPQTTLLDGYIQIPFKAEISGYKYTCNVITNDCEVMSAPVIFNSGEALTASFESRTINNPAYNYTVTINGNSYNCDNHDGIVRIPKDKTSANIQIEAYAYEKDIIWDGTFPTANANATYSGGKGTAEAPYLISTPRDLAWLSQNTNNIANYSSGKYFLMTNDIYLNDDTFTDLGNNFVEVTDGEQTAYISTDLTSIDENDNVLAGTFYTEQDTSSEIYSYVGLNQWMPIGGVSYSFSGCFNGAFNIISGIFHNSSNIKVGLFGNSNSNSRFMNLSVVNGFIQGFYHVAGISGACSGVVINSFTDVSVVGYGVEPIDNNNVLVGGCVGYGSSCYIINCCNFGCIYARYEAVAGISGYITKAGFIYNSCNLGFITGGDHMGGVLGATYDGGSLYNCYNLGSINSIYDPNGTGGFLIGGVAGFTDELISNCVSTGNVSNGNRKGAITGRKADSISSNYYLTGCAGEGVLGVGTSSGSEENGTAPLSANVARIVFDYTYDEETYEPMCSIESTNVDKFIKAAGLTESSENDIFLFEFDGELWKMNGGYYTQKELTTIFGITIPHKYQPEAGYKIAVFGYKH